MTALHRQLPPLYPLFGSGQGDVESLARACLEGGARLLQLREKPPAQASSSLQEAWQKKTLHVARSLAALCRRHQALLIINDRADWVIPSQAHGVHLGQDDLSPQRARRLLGEKAIIGYSTHNQEQFAAAQDLPVDYLALGPIFRSPTKPGANPPLGLERLQTLCAASRLPVVAIGGINLQRALRVWEAGAASIAVISDIAGHPDPSARVRSYLQAYRRLRRA
ncbi:MAG TPA: thiamine phosphate synthase [Acidobacteriota bacterium]|nr:thiamine phosphate synthase [Acidobacteriota bacterium]